MAIRRKERVRRRRTKDRRPACRAEKRRSKDGKRYKGISGGYGRKRREERNRAEEGQRGEGPARTPLFYFQHGKRISRNMGHLKESGEPLREEDRRPEKEAVEVQAAEKAYRSGTWLAGTGARQIGKGGIKGTRRIRQKRETEASNKAARSEKPLKTEAERKTEPVGHGKEGRADSRIRRYRRRNSAGEPEKKKWMQQLQRQKNSQRKEMQRRAARQAARQAAKGAQKIGALAMAALGGGGVIIALLCAVGVLLASPFGIFFGGGDSGHSMSVTEAVQLINEEFAADVSAVTAGGVYDQIIIHSQDGTARIANWPDILTVYAVRVGSEREIAQMDAERVALLREVAEDMTGIDAELETQGGPETETETSEEGETDAAQESQEESAAETEPGKTGRTILHLTVWTKTVEEMAEQYSFSIWQRNLLADLLEPEYQEMLVALAGSYGDVSVPDSEGILDGLPADLDAGRKSVVLTAYSLVGKVGYFWGGKSYVKGWDNRWGTPTRVTAAGSESTGTIRPYGLDCSGYVGWVFYNALDYRCTQGAASQYREWCTKIGWEQLQPGDLVFYADLSHVGIVVQNAGGILTIAQYGDAGVGIVTQAGQNGGKFRLAGRPSVWG